MKELFVSIYEYYELDPLAERVALYNTEAPSNATYPYMVFSMVSNIQEFTFTEDFENCLLQFNIFSNQNSPEEICDLFELVKGDTALGTGFDFLELTLTNYLTVSMLRENAILIKLEDMIWQYNILYRIVLEYDGVAVHSVVNKYLYNLMSI